MFGKGPPNAWNHHAGLENMNKEKPRTPENHQDTPEQRISQQKGPLVASGRKSVSQGMWVSLSVKVNMLNDWRREFVVSLCVRKVGGAEDSRRAFAFIKAVFNFPREAPWRLALKKMPSRKIGQYQSNNFQISPRKCECKALANLHNQFCKLDFFFFCLHSDSEDACFLYFKATIQIKWTPFIFSGSESVGVLPWEECQMTRHFKASCCRAMDTFFFLYINNAGWLVYLLLVFICTP